MKRTQAPVLSRLLICIAGLASALPGASAAQTVQTVTQYSYDLDGRLECTAVRMNPATYASLPASACVPATSGSAGSDRITRNHYDPADQLLRVQKAYGTPLQQDYATYEYTLNGKRKAVTDANGNRAEMTFDGHDNQTRWIFPSKTVTGAADQADYEEYSYDANGNRTSLRKRDGRSITYAYDALNRVTSKVYPGGGARAVHYEYDLRGLQTAARFDSASGGDAILSGWDSFGRQSSSTTSMGGTSRTLTSGYDANGNRIWIAHPDSQYFDYHYHANDQLYFAQLNGATPLFHPTYDAAGRVASLLRLNVSAWNWTFGTNYTYDGISRLSSYGHVLTNAGANVTTSFGYNPASQVVSRTRDNDDYRFNGHANVNRSYARNGLNQYTSAGSASFAYDANGNLTSDGTISYAYDIENRLIGTSTGVVLTYDPLGRLWQTYSPTAGTTQFLYDGDALVAEYDGAGAMLKRYLHGTAEGQDDPLVEYIGSGTSSPRYLFADHQGSIIAIADASGNRIAANGYDEYGIPNGYAGSGTPNTGRFQYTGQAWIPELGMYHHKARVYSPTLGRFLQTDPIGYDDQINLYAYVANDPVNKVDPDGKQSDSVMDRRMEALRDVGKDCAGQGGACGKTLAQGVAVGVAGGAVIVAVAAVAPEAAAVAATNAARAAATEAVAGGSTRGAVSGLVTRAREVFTGASTRAGGPGVPTNPTVAKVAEGVPASSRSVFHGCCGEVNAVSKALNAGADVAGSTIRTISVQTGKVMEACSSCQAILKEFGVKF